MNPENTQTPSQPQVSPPPQVDQPLAESAVPAVAPPPAKKTPMEMIGMLLDGVKAKLQKPKVETAITGTGEPTPASPSDQTPKKFKIPKKVILIVIAVVVILVVLTVVMSMMNRNGGSIIQTPMPSVTPTSTPITEVPSQYADDEDVAQIKSQMEELNKTLNESSFRDETLRIPTLDWNVSFEE